MKRRLMLSVLALTALGGCATAEQPVAVRTASESPAEATSSESPAGATASTPAVEVSLSGTKADFQAIMAPYVANPVLVHYLGAAAASDYQTMRELAPSLGAAVKTTADALASSTWPADIQPDMDAFVVGMRGDVAQLEGVAATTTDEETESYVATHQPSDASAGDKVSADFGIVTE